MRIARYLAIPVFLFALLGCGLANGVQQIQQAVPQLPAALTSMPTMLGAMSTMAPGGTGSGTAIPGTLPVSLATVRGLLQAMGQFAFTDSTSGGQPDTIVTLSGPVVSIFPQIATGFRADFIGDPDHLSRIKIVLPGDVSARTLQEGMQVITEIFNGILPPTVLGPFVTWLNQTYPNLSVGSSQQTTIGVFRFTLTHSQTAMTLEIDPANQ
jgi:hypothetical protein